MVRYKLIFYYTISSECIFFLGSLMIKLLLKVERGSSSGLAPASALQNQLTFLFALFTPYGAISSKAIQICGFNASARERVRRQLSHNSKECLSPVKLMSENKNRKSDKINEICDNGCQHCRQSKEGSALP